MLKEKLKSIISLIKEQKPNIDIDMFAEFIMTYNPGNEIYPVTLKKALNCELKEAYEILEILAHNDYVKVCMQAYCPECKCFVGKKYETIGEIPEKIYCEKCGKEIEDPFGNIYVFYQMN